MGTPRIHYAPEYNLDLPGLDAFHPFDMEKAGKTLGLLRTRLGAARIDPCIVPVTAEATTEALELCHSRAYLASLADGATVAAALELPMLADLPSRVRDRHILRPMRFAVQGSIDAMRSAVETGVGVNLAGGFHHASHARGEGFCLYADVVTAYLRLRREGVLGAAQQVLYVDLDAHQGNGVARLCHHHALDAVKILDLYNADIFPYDTVAAKYIDFAVPLASGVRSDDYLEKLRTALADALGQFSPALLIYNAGTDILAGDPLGNLSVGIEGVMARDRYVIDTCRASAIPLLIVPSGGYTPQSHRLIAALIEYLIVT